MAPQLQDPLLLALRLDRGEVGFERRFNIDDDVALLGHVHHHVGPDGAGVGIAVQLLGKIDVRGHAGQFDQPPKSDLAPLPAHVGPAQGGNQIARFARQQMLAAGQDFHLSLERGKRVDAIALDRLNLCFGLGQCLANGLHQGLDGSLALLQRLRGVRLLAAEPFARQLQEHLAVALQAVARQFAEHALQLLTRTRQGLFTLCAQRFLGLEPRPQ